MTTRGHQCKTVNIDLVVSVYIEGWFTITTVVYVSKTKVSCLLTAMTKVFEWVSVTKNILISH